LVRMPVSGVSPKKPLINTIRDWLPTAKRAKVLKDTERVTGWVYAAIKSICQEQGVG